MPRRRLLRKVAAAARTFRHDEGTNAKPTDFERRERELTRGDAFRKIVHHFADSTSASSGISARASYRVSDKTRAGKNGRAFVLFNRGDQFNNEKRAFSFSLFKESSFQLLEDFQQPFVNEILYKFVITPCDTFVKGSNSGKAGKVPPRERTVAVSSWREARITRLIAHQ